MSKYEITKEAVEVKTTKTIFRVSGFTFNSFEEAQQYVIGQMIMALLIKQCRQRLSTQTLCAVTDCLAPYVKLKQEALEIVEPKGP